MNRPKSKTTESKVLKGSQHKSKVNSRPKSFKPKVLNDHKPYFTKSKVQSQKKSLNNP